MSVPALFSPLILGPLTLPNRIVMAPMTRGRADDRGVPSPFAADYYAQRAGAGLIISEATQVDPLGRGYPGTPGLHAEGPLAGWSPVTQAVHEAGGRIYLQLWHAGRISHSCMHPGGRLPVGPSAIPAEGELFTTRGRQGFETPRALATAEVRSVVAMFARAATLALRAGFDGVDLHAANGYLLDQFLRDGSNRRSDRYGGPIPNRARLLLEVLEAVAGVWGSERIGLRISPLQPYNSMCDSDPRRLFGYVAAGAARLGLGYLHVVEHVPGHPRATAEGADLLRRLRRAFPGCMIVDGGRDGSSAAAALRATGADLVALATPFIANPDLVERIALGMPLAEPDPAFYYEGGARGYTDYPRHTAALPIAVGPRC